MTAAPRPRTVTAAVLALWLLIVCAVGAGDARSRAAGGVTVLATWTGAEGEAFRRVLADFTAATGINVDYQGTTALREVLLSEVGAGTSPDIAILPSAGEVADYAVRKKALKSLDGVLGRAQWDAFDPLWTPAFDGHTYAFPVKADLKSVVWYDPARHRPGELAALARDGRQWCAGMGDGAASGWPGTDWIEDLLLQRRGRGVYEKWAAGELPWTSPEVAGAWKAFGGIFGAGPAKSALNRGFAGAGARMAGPSPQCAMEHQGTFARGSYPPGLKADFADSARVLPGADRRSTAHEVSADFAAMFHATAQAERLMRYLASDRARTAWTADPPEGALPPFFVDKAPPRSARYPDAVSRRAAAALHTPGARCLDASDSMPPPLRTAFQRAVLKFLSDPGQDLDALLREVDQVRERVRGAPWPPRVCG
ncbi:ABC transporter substrate-binding protein [Streptomyces varsoviensis]|uniref:ABC transporter substrate-binding protein n=1 Tax=Streptomyces varsoviensis TaxID=67373 RepID=UPI000568E190|nr:ABC transporter substrate-binding protein [Streptomyces varsoviensis]